MAKSLNKQVKENEEESFVTLPKKSNEIINLKFDIVKYIIKDKLNAIDNRNKEQERKARKNQILELIKEKQNNQLKEKSMEELEKELANLE